MDMVNNCFRDVMDFRSNTMIPPPSTVSIRKTKKEKSDLEIVNFVENETFEIFSIFRGFLVKLFIFGIFPESSEFSLFSYF